MIAIAVDPVNLLFIALFSWMTYASGYGSLLWQAMRANHWGFVRPGKVQPLGIVRPEHELK